MESMNLTSVLYSALGRLRSACLASRNKLQNFLKLPKCAALVMQHIDILGSETEDLEVGKVFRIFSQAPSRLTDPQEIHRMYRMRFLKIS